MDATTAPLFNKGQLHPPSRPRPQWFEALRYRLFLLVLVLLTAPVLYFIVTAAVDSAWPSCSLCRPKLELVHGVMLPAAKPTIHSSTSGRDASSTFSAPVTAKASTFSSVQPSPTVLECFQVAQPVLTPAGATTSRDAGPASDVCTVTLMRHDFGNSYNAPFVGDYTPPACKFNRVALNLTVVSQGRQFDRLAIMYLGDTEVWRTSTAEPVAPPGIRWVHLKDMTPFMALWRQPNKVIFDMGNLLNDKYTGLFNTTLTATFFYELEADRDSLDSMDGPSDIIIPISAQKSATNGASLFVLPAQNATVTVTNFPRNARRAVFSLSANGQADEEFWWSNMLASDVLAFNVTTGGAAPGFSPFREVQVLVDGQLAGVQWPFPVVFTGGVVPSLHRPVVGQDVFDLREHEIDLTPWLPVLCDGHPHTFSIQVAGMVDDPVAGTAALTSSVGNSWYVTGKVFVWLDAGDDGDADAVTTGQAPIVSSTPPQITVTQYMQRNATGVNETLTYTVEVRRQLRVVGFVQTPSSATAAGGDGGGKAVSWTQDLQYGNEGTVSAFGFNQVNTFTLTGRDRAEWTKADTSNRDHRPLALVYVANYSFPLFCNTTTAISSQGNLSLWAHMEQGLTLDVAGAAVFPTGLEVFQALATAAGQQPYTSSHLDSRVVGTASFTQTGDGRNSSGFGSTQQTFWFGGGSTAGMLGTTQSVALYTRDVAAVNQTLVRDVEIVAGRGMTEATSESVGLLAGDMFFAQAPRDGGGTGPRVFLGRGGPNPTVATTVSD